MPVRVRTNTRWVLVIAILLCVIVGVLYVLWLRGTEAPTTHIDAFVDGLVGVHITEFDTSFELDDSTILAELASALRSATWHRAEYENVQGVPLRPRIADLITVTLVYENGSMKEFLFVAEEYWVFLDDAAEGSWDVSGAGLERFWQDAWRLRHEEPR